MKTVDLSGFGGSYELACQLMLKAGMDHLKAHGIPTEKEMNRNPCSQKVRDFENAVVAGCTEGPTGAQVGVALSHAWQRSFLGDEKYFELVLEQRDPQDIFEWDGTINTIPVTDFSIKMEGDNRGNKTKST